jgi:hypothetical protein
MSSEYTKFHPTPNRDVAPDVQSQTRPVIDQEEIPSESELTT